jgi:hypothetical protein
MLQNINKIFNILMESLAATTFNIQANSFKEADEHINYVINNFMQKFAEQMGLPDPMIDKLSSKKEK